MNRLAKLEGLLKLAAWNKTETLLAMRKGFLSCNGLKDG